MRDGFTAHIPTIIKKFPLASTSLLNHIRQQETSLVKGLAWEYGIYGNSCIETTQLVSN
jgi:hypothetical protein